MISGIGIDVIEIQRIKDVIEKWDEKFVVRLFSRDEILRCRQRANPAECFAVRFAAKEALAKAVGHGWCRHFRWTDVEVVNDQAGKPDLRIIGITARLVENKRVMLSLTHTREYAAAMVIVEDGR
ncbi:MAG TPA: holo-ACP synthase [bacterium]